MKRSAPGVPVWDALVRICHWGLVLAVALAWYTRHGGHERHEQIGYAALTIVLVRIVWGFTGPGRARFADFVRSPRETFAYARRVLARSEPRTVGHNPLGGWMIVALLGMIALVGFTGWLYTTDRFWGDENVERLHGTLSDVLLFLIALHVAGVAYTSFRHRENLVAAMLHGRKRP